MAYQRKTRDVWDILTNWGYGWEVETTETSYAEAREQIKCYKDNACGRFSVRLRRRREEIEA